MFYVGVYAYYPGANVARHSKVKKLEKLGRSEGRAHRFIKSHLPVQDTHDQNMYRAMVLVLPNGFVLRNDMIQSAVKAYQCDWLHAKFQVYRLAAVNILARQEDWQDLVQAATESAPTEVESVDTKTT